MDIHLIISILTGIVAYVLSSYVVYLVLCDYTVLYGLRQYIKLCLSHSLLLYLNLLLAALSVIAGLWFYSVSDPI